MALGRSGLRQALRQSHLQLSQSKIFMPSILLMRILALSAQLGLSFLFLDISSSFWNLIAFIRIFVLTGDITCSSRVECRVYRQSVPCVELSQW